MNCYEKKKVAIDRDAEMILDSAREEIATTENHSGGGDRPSIVLYGSAFATSSGMVCGAKHNAVAMRAEIRLRISIVLRITVPLCYYAAARSYIKKPTNV